MATIKNIIWSGSGKTGLPILERVLATNQFNIKLLVRNPISTYDNLPSSLSSVHEVDYANHASLVEHLRGYDAVIVFCSFFPGSSFDTKHIALVNAAIEAGVKYFIPSEWALDTAGIMGSTSARYGPTLPTGLVLAPKRVSHNYLLCRAGEKKIRFAVVYTGVLVESCMKVGMLGFDFKTHSANLPDNGVNPFPASSYATLTKAILSLFNDPEKISNRFYHISDGVLTLNDVFQIVQRESKVQWKRSSYSIDVVREAAAENIKNGVYTAKEFVHTLLTPFFGGLQVFTKLDNEILGIGEGEKVDLREEVARLVHERV